LPPVLQYGGVMQRPPEVADAMINARASSGCTAAGRPRDMIHAGSRPDLGTLDQRFSCVLAMSVGETDEAKSWPGEHGFVHACVRRQLKGKFSESEFYLAGPPPMVDAVRPLLVLEEHVAVERIHYDRFFSFILVTSRT
jgi:toluene monooxygenase electron transfer component